MCSNDTSSTAAHSTNFGTSCSLSPFTRKMCARDFEVLRHVGSGNFSNVYHVRRCDLPREVARRPDIITDFAMKKISKSRVKSLHKEKEVIMERHCLIKLQSRLSDSQWNQKNTVVTSNNLQSTEDTVIASEINPREITHQYHTPKDPANTIQFSKHTNKQQNTDIIPQNIIQLYSTFQDTESVYLIMEYCQEGELWEMISGIGLMDYELGRFFIAQLINAIEYCHFQGVVHRDLKAENILIDSNGTLKLIDFGTAIDMECPTIKSAGNRSRGSNGRVYEYFVGTAEFMAPETVKNKNSGRLQDLWSLGCTIYQILAGVPPFSAPSEFLSFLLSSNLEIEFPPHFPYKAENLIKQLLRIIPEERLGANGIGQNNMAEIKAHEYFEGIDFNNVHIMIENRLPYPPIQDSCVSYMAKHWERYKLKWIECSLLDENGNLLPTTNNVPKLSVQKDNLYCDDELKDVTQSSNSIDTTSIIWEKPSPLVDLEGKSRQLLQYMRQHPSVRSRQLQERLIYMKEIQNQRNQEFWDTRVKKFLESKNS